MSSTHSSFHLRGAALASWAIYLPVNQNNLVSLMFPSCYVRVTFVSRLCNFFNLFRLSACEILPIYVTLQLD